MDQLLTTKLFIPPVRQKLVTRPRLIERLNQGLSQNQAFGRKLTLISAPAGFGKTTLVNEWMENLRGGSEKEHQIEIRIAWLSLDEGDNDLVSFLAYLIAALNQRVEAEFGLGKGALSMLRSPQPPPAEAVLTSLINDVAATPGKIILVLDDYHLIDNQPIHEALTFFLEHLPGQMHLVISTREDPNVPLARLRARGQLIELRAADMRFTSTEAAEFFNRVMGLNLSVENVAALETSTEGWIAGLQLAALALKGPRSMERSRDASALIKSFTGSHHYVVDYLIEEVLERQPESVQSFLLQTSVLEKLTGSLCDILTGQENSQLTLEMLERANLFIVPLDNERCWYRYHHLFSDLLRQRLNQIQPEQWIILNRRASEWYEQNGFAEDAIEHALRAEDFERAAHLIESVADGVWARGGDTKLRRWLKRLPDELVLSKPHLCIFRAWELFASGRQNAAERFLQAAELAHDPNADRAIVSETQKRDQRPGANRLAVRGRAAAIRAWMAAYRADILGIIQHSHQALEYLPERDLNWRSAAAITLGDAYFLKGDYYASYQARADAMEASKAAGNIYLFMNVSVKQALTLKALGQLSQVKELCQQRLQLAGENGMSQTAVAGWLLAIFGEVLAETNDLDGALDLVEKGIELTERGRDVVMLGWSCLCLTRVLFSMGDMVGADEIVQKMNSVALESILPIWIMNLNAAWQSRIWLAQGKLDVASQWVEDRGLAPDIEPTYVGGLEYIAFARILIAHGRWDEAITLLQLMLDAAEAGGNITRVIEIIMLQALAFQAAGDTTRAVTTLERALALAEPRGFFRIFVDEGPSMARLFYEALDRGITPNYVNRLLQAFPIDKPDHVDPPVSLVSESGYIEPLSKREIEILQLIAGGLTNPEIAARLVLSLYTVKTHTRNIYGKLGVNNRTQAVAKARAFGIFSAT